MKHLIWISALLLVLNACSKEEAALTPVEETAAVTQEAAESAAASKTTEEAASEALVVVEESASEAEPVDEAIVLALAEPPAALREWQFKEGQHYSRMVPTQPTFGSPDKIEVAEFFSYGCPHCYRMEPIINKWAETKDPSVRFVRVPATWNALYLMHGQLYYTEEILVRNGVIKNAAEFREAIFEEYHRRGNRMTSQDAIQKVFARFGVSKDEFDRTWNSFEVNQKLRIAGDLMRRYSVSSVPVIVVNGKYRTSAAEAGDYEKLVELIDELVVRESLR